jgi:HEAT repeat protein
MRPVLLALFLLYGAIDEWSEFRRLSRDRDPDRRCEAVELLRPRADLEMVHALLPLLADPHARVRKRAGEAIARAGSPECVEFLTKAGLRHPLKPVRARVAGILGTMRDAAAVPALESLLADDDPDVRAAACESLAAIGSRASAPAIAKRAGRDPAALEALSLLDASAAEPFAMSAASDKSWRVRLAAARVAPSLAEEAALRVYAKTVADVDWRVRVQAMESACLIRKKAVIGPLIELLGKEPGRLRWDAWLALRDITGKEMGLEAAPWKRWWEVQKDGFEPPPPGAPDQPRPGGETGVSFFSIPILSTRTAFVFDLSGSMRDPAPSGSESKLDVAKREAARTFAKLPESAWFNVLLLGCESDGKYEKPRMVWKRTLQPATPAGRGDAVSFLNRQVGKGWTNIWDGIELAFEDDLVDTIYLYTDGGASRGTFVATADILGELARMNRCRKIMIHTIEVPAEKPNTADNIRLLKGIAEGTKGLYRLAK